MTTKRICVTIDLEDFAYCKTTGLRPSRVLRSAMLKIRNQHEDNIDYELANKRLRGKLERVFNKLAQHMTPEDFDELLQKI